MSGRRGLVLAAVSLLLVGVPPRFVLASESAVPPPTKLGVAPDNTKPPPKQVAGIFYGHITHLDLENREIVVRALEKRFGEKLFHFDGKTKFRVNKKPKKARSLFFGDKVAVRYFGDEEVQVADAVFVVFGEFNASDYVEKRRKK